MAKHADDFGLKIEKISFDLDKVVKRSRGVASQLSAGVKHLLKKNKVDHIEGNAALTGKNSLKVTDKNGKETVIQGKDIVLATGARARQLPHLQADEKLVWTYKKAMTPDEMPKSLLVIGSGAIGIEFASFYRELGAEVTVVEMMDRILPVEDHEVSAFAEQSFKKQGMEILKKSSVTELKKGTNNVTCVIDIAGKKVEKTVDRVILAIGITGNIENIGLEQVGVKTDRGHIVTNEWGQTNIPGIWAIGDVAGAPWLAHKASHEGVIAIEKIAETKRSSPNG